MEYRFQTEILRPIRIDQEGSMKGQHPVTATRFASTALAISLVLKCSCRLYIWTSADTIVCVIPPDAAARHMVRAILPTAA